jgi:hypothetical protein
MPEAITPEYLFSQGFSLISDFRLQADEAPSSRESNSLVRLCGAGEPKVCQGILLKSQSLIIYRSPRLLRETHNRGRHKKEIRAYDRSRNCWRSAHWDAHWDMRSWQRLSGGWFHSINLLASWDFALVNDTVIISAVKNKKESQLLVEAQRARKFRIRNAYP